MSPLARNIIRGVQFAFAVVVLGTVGYCEDSISDPRRAGRLANQPDSPQPIYW
jgi:hypothetical protein